MSLQKPKNYILKIGLTSYLNQTKSETSFKVVTSTSLIITKSLIPMNSQNKVKRGIALIKMILRVV